jgi:hypothetical protein
VGGAKEKYRKNWLTYEIKRGRRANIMEYFNARYAARGIRYDE